MIRCCADGCKNPGVHKFPKCMKLQKLWEKAVNRIDFTHKPWHRLCSAHFKSDDYITESYATGLKITRRILRKGAVPSIFVYKTDLGLPDIEGTLPQEQVEKQKQLAKTEDGVVDLDELQPSSVQTFESSEGSATEMLAYIKEEFTEVEPSENIEDAEDLPLLSVAKIEEEFIEDEPSVSTDNDSNLSVNMPTKIKEELVEVELTENMQSGNDFLSQSANMPVKIEEESVEDDLGLLSNVKEESIDEEPSMNAQNYANPSSKSVGIQRNFQFYSIESFRDDDHGVCFYTGLESFATFMLVFSILCPDAYSVTVPGCEAMQLSHEDQFLLTLMKLKRNTEDYELSRFFAVPEDSISELVCTWICFLHEMWSILDTWPSGELIDFYMQEQSENLQSAAALDSCEIIEKPANPTAGQGRFESKDGRISSPVNGAMSGQAVPHVHKLSQKLKIADLTEKYKILQTPLKNCFIPLTAKIYGVCHMLHSFKNISCIKLQYTM